jgi:hypothetical protein
MSNKIKLILRQGEFTSFTSYYLEALWREFFDIEIYDPDRIYPKSSTLFAVWWDSIDDPYTVGLKQQGYKVVIDNLWEAATGRSDSVWLENEKWWWWNESLWWRALGLHDYRPNKDITYLALMQLRQQKPERTHILSKMSHLLPLMLYSCAWQGRHLPHDNLDPEQGQRHMHASWYDLTYCSVVVETGVIKDHRFFATEKSFKPFAYFHPFVSVSHPGTLGWLKSLGFETFDTLFDESYDTVEDLDVRLDIISRNLGGIDLSVKDYDKITNDKIKHNHELFFSQARCREGIIDEIIRPLLHYAET